MNGSGFNLLLPFLYQEKKMTLEQQMEKISSKILIFGLQISFCSEANNSFLGSAATKDASCLCEPVH